MSQYAEGTAGREVIDAIPNAPATQVPRQAVITASSQPDPDAVHLEYEAAGATTFEVLQKGPGEPKFEVGLEDLIARGGGHHGAGAGSLYLQGARAEFPGRRAGQ